MSVWLFRFRAQTTHRRQAGAHAGLPIEDCVCSDARIARSARIFRAVDENTRRHRLFFLWTLATLQKLVEGITGNFTFGHLAHLPPTRFAGLADLRVMILPGSVIPNPEGYG